MIQAGGELRTRANTEFLKSETWADVRAKLMLLRSWQDEGTERTDALEQYLVAGAIIDIEKIADRERKISLSASR